MPRTVVTGVAEYTVDGDSLALDCTVRRAERPLEEGDIEPVDAGVESTFGEDEEGEPLGNVPFDDERTVPVTLRFLNPATFRFELRPNADAGTPSRLIDLNEAAIEREVDLDVTERDGTLRVETSDLVVRIGTDRWSFDVRDQHGTLLFSEQRADFNSKGVAGAEPLGYTETTVSRWPYAVAETGTAFRLGANEHLYGFGEKFTEFDKRGQHIDARITQPNGNETEAAYKTVPFYLSTRGYGLLVDTPERVEFDIGNESTVSGEITVDGDSLSFLFFHGPDFSEILERYTALTGRSSRPPKWTFGIWLSRYGLKTRDLVEGIVDRIRAEQIPWDAIKIDPYWLRRGHSCDLVWDRDAFPDPEGMLESFHERGIKIVLWEHPYVPAGTEAFESACDNGYFVEDGRGKPLVLDRLCESTQRGGIVDFTDPEAVEWWQERHRRLLEMGVDGFWTDFGEYLPRDAVLANGRNGRSMGNVYPDRYNEAVYEVTAEVHGQDDAFVWARSGWIGGQQYPMYWSGDPQSTFEAMGSVLRGGLSFALSGYPFWSHDVGGFTGQPSMELYLRWAQFGLLTTQTRFHGTTPREPWAFGEQAVEVVREFARLRYSLLPYLYTYAEVACRTGMPVMRPLVLEFQNDPAVRNDGTQYLLGESLLVAPVLEPGGSVEVYLPDGTWMDHWSGERYNGQQTLVRDDVPIDELPLFVRVESVIPMREPTQYVHPGTPECVSLEIALARDGETEASTPFYDEDADSLLDVSVRLTGGRSRLEISVSEPERTGMFDGTVRGVSAAPDDVLCNGDPLDRVPDDPDGGEWSYDGTADTLRFDLTE